MGDLPFGSYETSAQQAVQSAVRMMKEGLMDAVKLEGAPYLRAALCRRQASPCDMQTQVPALPGELRRHAHGVA